MTVFHLLLGRPWKYDRAAMHDGLSNFYSFKWNNKKFVLRPMTPSQIIVDNAKALDRKQEDQGNRKLSGERETHLKESECHFHERINGPHPLIHQKGDARAEGQPINASLRPHWQGRSS